MALLEYCIKCGKICDATYSLYCNDCNGTNDNKKKEAARWASLPLEQKVEELKARLEALENKTEVTW